MIAARQVSDDISSQAAARKGHAELVYRPEVDGLRAVAVGIVVLYHLGLSCPGGFVGVDVFFVLSGYLITALLLRDFIAGRFTLANFWERRVRRIFPAAAVMVAVTLLVGCVWMLPGDFAVLGKSAIAQALMGSNVFFWKQQGGYFEGLDVHPLLHTWSLAVEEQFYLFYPFLLVGIFRWKREAWQRWFWAALVCIGVASLALAVMRLAANPSAVFFLLPTRAWELLCGAALAALPARFVCEQRGLREMVGWLGLAAILAPVWLYSEATPFPGLAALPPCLGTVAVIWSNTRTGRDPGLNTVGRLLAAKPVVFVGLISYSLYLWHWPVIVFGLYGLPPLESLSVALKLALLVVSVGLAILSWRYVETPFRTKQVASSRRVLFAGAIACSVGFMGLGVVAMQQRASLSARLPAGVGVAMRANSDALQDRGPFFNVTLRAIQAGDVRRFGDTSSGKPATLLLWGDSHARHALPALDEFCQRLGVAGEAVVYSSTYPLVNAVFETQAGLDEQSPAWADGVLARVQQQGIKHVVLSGFWGSTDRDKALLAKALPETIRRLAALGCTVWVLLDVPIQQSFPPRSLARAAVTGEKVEPWLTTPAEHRRNNAVMYELLAAGLPARFLDPAPLLLNADGSRYEIEQGGVSLYYDTHHVTSRASKLIFLPLFQRELAPALAAAQASASLAQTSGR